MPQFHNPKFLLDENASHNLKKLLTSKGYDVLTVQELNKRGTKNSELLDLARKKSRILITYDKDFVNIKHDSDAYLILVDIHPLIDENVLPNFEKFLQSFSFEDLKNNYIILNEEGMLLKKK